MGLFDFIKNVGNDIFGGDDEQEKITELITTELGDKVNELNVEFDDGLVTLSGSCDSQETKEKAESQLSEVVAALETIRLDLLRLTAGVGTLDGLTTNLLAAGKIQSNVGHLVEGMREVEAALKSADQGGA